MFPPQNFLYRVLAMAATRSWPSALMLGAMLLVSATSAQDRAPAAADPQSAWREVVSVLTHPRCLNCHTVTDYPRQNDNAQRHKFGVVRGKGGRGAPGAQCSTCHGSGNNASSGVPGAKDWHLAPLSMAWESKPGVTMDAGRLCAVLKDKKLNGNRELAALTEHLRNDALVKWAWAPGVHPNGTARTTPPLSHEQFMAAFEVWAAAGGPCPP